MADKDITITHACTDTDVCMEVIAVQKKLEAAEKTIKKIYKYVFGCCDSGHHASAYWIKNVIERRRVM